MESLKINQKEIFRESKSRSFFKAVIYRVFSVIGTGSLTWFITKDFGETISITIAIQIFLSILYYFHERIWNKIKWGKRI